MELTGYVEALQRELAVAAAAGGEESARLAERLTSPLDAAVRLVLQEALFDAAQEITRELAPGSVEIRLAGRGLAFVVTPAPAEEPEAPSGLASLGPERLGAPGAAEAQGEGATSRISFRPPDHLKAQIDEAAERAGLSVNAFLVRTLTAALAGPAAPGRSAPRAPRSGQHLSGWAH